MTKHSDFLFEIGTEELPPKTLKPLAQELANQIIQGLDKAELAHGELRYFATPRRLAVLIKDVADTQASHSIERKGPATTAAFNPDGTPTSALEGFLRSCKSSPE